jgi:hypothetical protein
MRLHRSFRTCVAVDCGRVKRSRGWQSKMYKFDSAVFFPDAGPTVDLTKYF